MLWNEQQSIANSRPVGSFGAKHGPNAPSRAKHIEGFGEAVVVNDASVDGKQAHQQDDVATGKDHVEHLQRQKAVLYHQRCCIASHVNKVIITSSLH